MAEIQILSVIDCQSILEHITPGTIGNEASIGSWGTADQFVFMISNGDYVASDQGKSELNVNAHSGDVIQWTVTDPSSGQQHSAVLYGFTTNNPQALTTPVMIPESLNVYQPANVSAPQGPFTSVSYPDYVWEATLTQPNVNIQYSWKFVILDNDGNQKGAYSWDPFITVK